MRCIPVFLVLVSIIANVGANIDKAMLGPWDKLLLFESNDHRITYMGNDENCKKLPSFACFGWYEKERINGVLKVYKKIRSTWDKQPYELTWICENSNNEEWYTQMRRVGAVHVSDYNSDSADVIEIIGGKWTLEVYPPEIDF